MEVSFSKHSKVTLTVRLTNLLAISTSCKASIHKPNPALLELMTESDKNINYTISIKVGLSVILKKSDRIIGGAIAQPAP